jgi:hypothetical protein
LKHHNIRLLFLRLSLFKLSFFGIGTTQMKYLRKSTLELSSIIPNDSTEYFMKYLPSCLCLTLLFISTTFNYSTATPALNESLGLKTFILLAHPWQSEHLTLNLKINSQFEGVWQGKSIRGFWNIVDNQNKLQLINDPIDEAVFDIEYTIAELSYFSLTLIDYEGQKFSLTLAN